MELKKDVCKGCGAAIIWGTTSDGKRIPLDPKAAVYIASVGANGQLEATRASLLKEVEEGKNLFFAAVTHFATCPKASDFSKSKPKAEPAAPAVPEGFTPVVSSNLNSCKYGDRELQIQFKNGGIYNFVDVPGDVHEALMASSSPGSFYSREIKDVYKFTKVNP